jgi:hypothetical protein
MKLCTAAMHMATGRHEPLMLPAAAECRAPCNPLPALQPLPITAAAAAFATAAPLQPPLPRLLRLVPGVTAGTALAASIALPRPRPAPAAAATAPPAPKHIHPINRTTRRRRWLRLPLAGRGCPNAKKVPENAPRARARILRELLAAHAQPPVKVCLLLCVQLWVRVLRGGVHNVLQMQDGRRVGRCTPRLLLQGVLPHLTQRRPTQKRALRTGIKRTQHMLQVAALRALAHMQQLAWATPSAEWVCHVALQQAVQPAPTAGRHQRAAHLCAQHAPLAGLASRSGLGGQLRVPTFQERYCFHPRVVARINLRIGARVEQRAHQGDGEECASIHLQRGRRCMAMKESAQWSLGAWLRACTQLGTQQHKASATTWHWLKRRTDPEVAA